jgi:16S rRNA pseudouridine516 synthase
MARIDQLLASLGYGTRSEVRELIEAGRVSVGGVLATDPGRHAEAGEMALDGVALDHPERLLIALNKPLGRVCSHDSAEGPTIYSLLPERWQRRNPPVTSIGRLDKETTGLLLLTDLSSLVHRLTSPRHKVSKVYRAIVDRDLPVGLEAVFSSGELLLPGETKPCAPATLRRTGGREAEVELTEGRYHQVRRMFASQGCSVLELQRIRFGSLELGNLALGEWKELPVNYFGVD